MSLIDQRITIKAPMETVWNFLSDPSLIMQWNRTSRQLFVLTTKPAGVGARRRSVDVYGKARVEEITAWVENFGYEYKLIDGGFRELKGRYRLQETQKGVNLSWTLEYEPRGAFAGVRNLLSIRGRLKRDLVASLKHLKNIIEKTGATPDTDKQRRSAMRDAPDANARAALAAEVIARAPQQQAKTPTTRIVIDGDNVTYVPIEGLSVQNEAAEQPSGSEPLAQPAVETTPEATVGSRGESNIGVPTSDDMDVKGEGDEQAGKVESTPPVVAEQVKAAPVILSVREQPREVTSDKPTAAIPEPEVDPDDTKQQHTRVPEQIDVTGIGGDQSNSQSNSERIAHAAITVPVSLVAPPREDTPPPVKPGQQSEVTQTMDIPAVSEPPGLPERVPTAPYAAVGGDLLSYPTPPEPMSASLVETEDGRMRVESANTKRPDDDQSIWEVFGVKSPHKRATEELDAVVASVRESSTELKRAEASQSSNERDAVPPVNEVVDMPTVPIEKAAQPPVSSASGIQVQTVQPNETPPSWPPAPITIPEPPPDDELPTGQLALQRRAAVNVRSPFRSKR